jgi:hypothetical protein
VPCLLRVMLYIRYHGHVNLFMFICMCVSAYSGDARISLMLKVLKSLATQSHHLAYVLSLKAS